MGMIYLENVGIAIREEDIRRIEATGTSVFQFLVMPPATSQDFFQCSIEHILRVNVNIFAGKEVLLYEEFPLTISKEVVPLAEAKIMGELDEKVQSEILKRISNYMLSLRKQEIREHHKLRIQNQTEDEADLEVETERAAEVGGDTEEAIELEKQTKRIEYIRKHVEQHVLSSGAQTLQEVAQLIGSENQKFLEPIHEKIRNLIKKTKS